jgi:lamin tail-like protein/IPT/TIG domain-containing protein
MTKKVPLVYVCLAVFCLSFPVPDRLKAAGGGARQAPAVQAAQIIINEYQADPDTASGDANGDGTSNSTQDEFVELVNAGSMPLLVGGFTLSDSIQVRFTIPSGKVIPPGEAAVIFGGGTPVGAFGNAAANGLVFAASGAGLALNNGGDSIIIKDNLGAEVARRDYPSSDGNANQSITRSPDVTGGFVTHLSAAGSEGRRFSPGTLVNGRPFVSNDPTIDSISPGTHVAGGGAVTIIVIGSRFQNGARVKINGSPIGTTFISPMELSADPPLSVTDVPGRYLLTVENPDMAVSNSVALTVFATVGINEFLADPPDGSPGDSNGDGTRDSSQDEFVEVVNRTGSPINIGGFSISDGDQLRFTFPTAAILPAGEAAVVFGGGGPHGEFGNAAINGLVFTAVLSLNNTGDTIVLKDGAGSVIEQIIYSSSEGSANQSITRNPDVTGISFSPHSAITASHGTLFSPGTFADGAPFTAGPRIARIKPDRAPVGSEPFSIEIQGSGFDGGSSVLIDAVAVAAELRGADLITALVPISVTSVAGNHTVRVRNEGGNLSNAVTVFIIPPPPVLQLVLPRVVQVSSPNFNIFLEGDNFQASSVALVEDVVVSTVFRNRRELTATVPAQFAATAGTRRVRVRNGDGQESRIQLFEVALPGARINSISPREAEAGGPGFTLRITGASFRNGSVALFDQTQLVTRFISASNLEADVPASLITGVGLRAITVQNDDGATSNDFIFRVSPVPPLVFSIEPRAVIEGGGDVTLHITGEKFQPGAAARIIEDAGLGFRLDTMFVAPERLEARLPFAFSEKAGKVLLRVENPDFGVSNNVALNVLLKDPLVINEYLADPPDGAAGDGNGDGSRSSSQDEFVEIINRSTEPIDLSGYRLSDSESVRHVFAEGTIVPPFEAVVIFGGGAPAGKFGNAAQNKLVFKASTGGLSLNNGGDSIKLEDAEGRVVQEIKFSDVEGNANQSLNRDPDVDGAAFALHSIVSETASLFSPGTLAGGELLTIKPVLKSLSPMSIRAGTPAFTLTLFGEQFLPGSQVLFGQTPLVTAFLSSTEIRAEVSADKIVEGGAAFIRVLNPKGQLSEAQKFLITEDPPRIFSLAPQSAGTGAEDFEITVSGERFQPAAAVEVRGEAIQTRFITRTALAATLPKKFFTRATILDVRVLNADGNRSNAARLTVENGPLITRLSRSQIKAGAGPVELTVGGLAFKPGVVLFVNETAVATAFVSETLFMAQIPAELTASPGTITLQARNPDQGRSNKATITVVQ